MNVKNLTPPKFTEDEQALIVTDLLAMKKEQIGDFFARGGLPKSGTKEQLRARIEEALDDGTVSLSQVVEFLDEVIPWGKQHVYLYKGPQTPIDDWRKTDWVARLLKKKRFGKYLNARLPLVLPEKMKVSSILHEPRRLRVTAIKRRDWWERNEDYDDNTTTDEGDDVQLRAFVHRVTRSLVAFEWDLVANTAFLQICQLPTRFDYDEVAEEFFELFATWLDITKFQVVDMRPPIKKLHALEKTGAGETRSHGIKYRTMQGSHLEAKSPSATDALLKDAVIETALNGVQQTGIGHLGNFYWLPSKVANRTANPLEAEIHVNIFGPKNRINFLTPNTEETIRHVLSRIRNHSS